MDEVHEALKVTQEGIGTPELVVNAVGVGQLSGFLDTPNDTWDRIIEVNLIGSVNVIRGVLPGMVTLQRGTIVNICSIWSKAAGVDRSAYIGAKWGLLGVTKCLAEEYRAAGVSICAVSPGPVLTRMTTKMAPADASNWLDPEQVAEAIETVASGGRVFSGSEVEVFGAARPSGMHSHR
jgi:NAD(P)-dependent dehydrogenase (short-subunit alcohol dehydrogenase family)